MRHDRRTIGAAAELPATARDWNLLDRFAMVAIIPPPIAEACAEDAGRLRQIVRRLQQLRSLQRDGESGEIR